MLITFTPQYFLWETCGQSEKLFSPSQLAVEVGWFTAFHRRLWLVLASTTWKQYSIIKVLIQNLSSTVDSSTRWDIMNWSDMTSQTVMFMNIILLQKWPNLRASSGQHGFWKHGKSLKNMGNGEWGSGRGIWELGIWVQWRGLDCRHDKKAASSQLQCRTS